jgi:hypothetical protein
MRLSGCWALSACSQSPASSKSPRLRKTALFTGPLKLRGAGAQTAANDRQAITYLPYISQHHTSD